MNRLRFEKMDPSYNRKCCCYTTINSTGRVVNNNAPDTGCILDIPHITIVNEYLDVDLAKIAQNVFLVAALSPGERTKPLIATVRGVGGG